MGGIIIVSNRRTKGRERASKRRQTRGQNQIITILGAVVIGVALVAVILANRGGAAPVVAQSRLQLDPVLGNPDAPVTIVEYGAYACPACRYWHQSGIVKQILDQYPDKVRFIFRDFPVISPAYDHMAAELAQCALDQGQNQFWTLHNALYEQVQLRASQDDIILAAKALGIDAGALRACANAGTHKSTVDYDLNRAQALGLPGTPSFLVNEQRIFDASPDTLRQAIQKALGS
jgi:protein-disulfide isomerase